jgi:magnesium transporter
MDHMTAAVPIASPSMSVGEVLRMMRGQRYEAAGEVAVCEDGRLLAVVGIEELFAADAQTPVGELGDHDPPVVGPTTDQELAGWKAVRHGESSLAVVGDDGKFMGLIPPHRLLAVLLWEHDEDLARAGGLLKGTSAARSATEAAIPTRFWHRMPWLLVGLAGAFLSVDIVGSFEEELRREVSLAFFIPGIVYLADAVGTQTEALIIRGLPLGISIRRVFLKELVTGLLVGIALAAVFFPLALWRWGETDVSLAVALSLLGACSIATAVAMLLPWALQRSGLDPAFGSGPLATVVQDLLSIVVYLAVASAIVH